MKLKKLNSCKISDLRPISLVTIIYKIISKVHSERLRVGPEETILEVQGAAGKKIVDLVLIENEVVEENRSTGKKGVSFQDRLFEGIRLCGMEFFGLTLDRKGFGARWRKWIPDACHWYHIWC